ncbi:MAG: hypothetical protein J6334_00625, partial [Kiritimatiellae bacterium]|nr:hypothetical protein [Kiritimatiellia bacterium]
PDMRNYVGRTLPIEMWLWARTVPDPNPAFGGCPVPLVTNFVTGAKKGRESWLEIEPLKTRKNYRIVVHSGEAPKHAEKGNRQGRADFFSPFDHRPITADHIREQGKRGKLGVRLMALFATGDNGEKVVLPPTREQERIATAIDTDLPVMPFSGNVRDCAACGFGYATYGELFLPRQRQMLKRLGELINAYARRGVKERLAANVLAVGYSQFSTWHSMANTYWNQRQFPRNVFTRQSIPFAWDFVEGNPIEASTKRWEEVMHGVREKFFALVRTGAGTIMAGDARQTPPPEPSVIQTEFPYYDNVAYADLGDYFYTWLRPVLNELHPDLARHRSSPREEEITAFAYRHGGREAADRFYREAVEQALRAFRANSRPDYPSVFSFDFRSATFTARDIAPVAAFVEGLVKAGFVITAAWPLKDIRSNTVFGGETGTGFRSIYFVCRHRGDEAPTASRRDFIDTLRRELPLCLAHYRDLDRSLAPGDYASAAVAAGIRIYSGHARVLNADGSVFTAAEAIEEVLKAVEEIKRREQTGETVSGDPRAEVIAALARGEDPAALRRRIYAAYLKAEDAGHREASARYNAILNEWTSLTEESV